MRDPATTESDRVLEHVRESGVLISKVGEFGSILKIRPPLVFGKHHADIALARLDEALAAV